MLTGKVGRYEVHGHVAHRTAGELYAAREAARPPSTKNLFALTLLSERDTTQTAAVQLRPALRRYTSFVGAGYAQHHGVFAHQGRLVVAHEFVRGETLDRLLRVVERTHSAVFAVSIGIELARLIHEAHVYEDESVEVGQLVHGDVCPSTVMVTHDGRLVLVDAGLALAQSRLVPERSGLRGHLAYLAPERAASHEDIGPPADVYGLGLLLYEILAAAPAHDGKSDAELVSQAIRAHIAPLSSRVRVSEPVSKVITSALAREPLARPTAGDLMEELSGLRSSRLASWNLQEELAKLMARHFSHRAQAMRTMEERWTKRAIASGGARPAEVLGRAASEAGTVAARAPSRGSSTGAASRSTPDAPLARQPSSAVDGAIALPPTRGASIARIENVGPRAAAAFVPDLALDLALPAQPEDHADALPTDDLARPEAPVRPPPAPLSFVRGVVVCVVCALLVTVSTAWWPAEWREYGIAAGAALADAIHAVLAALGAL